MIREGEMIGGLKEFLEGKEEIILAFLFGSYYAGREMEESDIDLAILFKDATPQDKIASIWSELEDMLEGHVDLLILNNVRSTVAWEAMGGEKLVIKDENLYLKKMLELSREAVDFNNFILDFWRLKRNIEAQRDGSFDSHSEG